VTSNDSFDCNLEVVWLEITHQCNLRCIHCYEGNFHNKEENTLSLEQWKRVVCELVQHNVRRIIIIGGEPCCSSDLKDILLFTSNFHIDITVFTNATVMTKELLETIIATKARVKVSIYGHNATVHDLITTVPGSFEKLCKNVDCLLKHSVEVSASVVIMKENQDYIEDILGFVNKMGMRCSRCDIIRNVYNGTQSRHFPDHQKAMEKAFVTKPNFHTSKKAFIHNSLNNSCWYGKLVVASNGDIFPCEFERNITYGNILESPFDMILSSSVLKKCWCWNFSNVEHCADCEFRFACKDCRPLGLSLSNDLHTKNPRCLYNPHTGIWESVSSIVS